MKRAKVVLSASALQRALRINPNIVITGLHATVDPPYLQIFMHHDELFNDNADDEELTIVRLDYVQSDPAQTEQS